MRGDSHTHAACHAVGPAAKLSNFDFTSISDFRLQTSDSGPTHDACYSLGTESFLKESKMRIRCKDAFTVKSHFDFRLRLHFCFSDLSFQKVEWQRPKPRFQISGSISDFRLAQGSEIEIGTSISDFRFQTPARERNRNRDFDCRFQVPVLREGCFEKSEIRPAASVKKVREAFQDSPSISGFAPSSPPLPEMRGSDFRNVRVQASISISRFDFKVAFLSTDPSISISVLEATLFTQKCNRTLDFDFSPSNDISHAEMQSKPRFRFQSSISEASWICRETNL